MPAKHVLDHFQLFGFPKLVISQKCIILLGKNTLRSLRRSLLPRLLYAFCILSRWINIRQHDFALCSHKIKTLLYIGHLIKCVVAENLNDHLFISVDAPHGFSQPDFVHCSNVWNVKHIWSICFHVLSANLLYSRSVWVKVFIWKNRCITLLFGLLFRTQFLLSLFRTLFRTAKTFLWTPVPIPLL